MNAGVRIKTQIGYQILDQVWARTMDQVRDQVWDQVLDPVEVQIWDQVGDRVREAIDERKRKD